MKKQVIFLFFAVLALNIAAQSLQNIYQQPIIKLIPAANYGQNNDWDKIESNSNAEKSKQLAVAPDGSVFLSNKLRYSISKYDKSGNFVKEFGKKGGKSLSDFIYNPTVQGVLDGKYVYTAAVDGRLHFFDLNGSWVKTLRLDYMPLNTIPLKNGKIVILGHVPMRNGSKHILSICDTDTKKQKTITSETVSYAKENESRILISPIEYIAKDGSKQKGPAISISLPLNDTFISRERMATDSKGNLIIGYPMQGKIRIYSADGTKIKEFKLDMRRENISKEDMEGYYQKAKKQMDDLEKTINIENREYKEKYIAQYRSQLEKFRNPENYKQGLPYFAEMIVDSDDNILLFNFTKEEGSNKFDVITYSKNGNKIGTSSFVSDEYKLNFNPAVFKFYKGQIIAYQELKSKTGNNMRLVKFNLGK